MDEGLDQDHQRQASLGDQLGSSDRLGASKATFVCLLPQLLYPSKEAKTSAVVCQPLTKSCMYSSLTHRACQRGHWATTTARELTSV